MDNQMKPARIEFSSAALTVAERRILSDLSVDLTAPRIGIIGRNGSGKTSFARLLSGLVKPSEGTVRIDGLDPAKDRRAALSLVGILFQNPDHQLIFPTVVEELAFGLRQLGLDDPEAAARAQLDRFGKSHWAESHVHGLSQGQKQLVCLMAVLAMAPRILVLDEPFAGLDIPTRMQLGRYLDRYEGTLVHVTHDPDELTSYDHVLWIEAGKLEQQGLPADVLPAFTAQMEQKGESDDISDLSD